ncbi:MAG: hypothetical protein F9K36_15275 [Burkholderiaceae bacterium]|nr:MAG: hypothetical protein F9K36_15275 [Burkholderiaceae bacterium]
MDGIKRFKCANCHQPFRPDPRNAWHQRYCAASACRAASKAASQQRWRGKPENRDYFRGPEHVERVRAWRRAHPGYGRRASASSATPSPAASASQSSAAQAAAVPAGAALQEVVASEVLDAQRESGPQATPETAARSALQDLLQQQPVVLIGLLAHLSASTLQEDIALAGQRLLQLGLDVLASEVRA